MTEPTTDLETRLRAALDARARRDVPSSRTPPPVDWSAHGASEDGRSHRPRGTWWTSAAAVAAVLLALAGAMVGINRLAVAPASPTFGSTPSPTVTLPPDLADPGWTTALLRSGATVPVPSTWTSSPPPPDYPTEDAVCLGPVSAPCAIVVARLDPARGATVENDWGVDGDPGYCPAGTGRRVLGQAAAAQLSGRPAELRTFTWTCPDRTVQLVQYVVPTVPAFVVHSDRLELPQVAAAFERIVRSAVLPDQSAPLRIYDQGRVQSIVAAGDGYDLRLTRYVGGYVNDWVPTTTTTTYHLPASVLSAVNGLPWQNLARSQVVLRTDGTRVTHLVVPGG